MTERVVCIIQARQGSARLPGKSLRVLQGRPLIAHVIERAKAIVGVDDVVLATSDKGVDDALAEYVRGLGTGVFRGSEQNVLERVFFAATLARATTIMRVTGDCPFLDPYIANRLLNEFRNNDARYAWNDTSRSGYPDGTDVEVFDYKILVDAMMGAVTQPDLEHVTPWIRAHVQPLVITSGVDFSRLKLSVDSPDDFERARQIAAHIPAGVYYLGATLEAYRKVYG